MITINSGSIQNPNDGINPDDGGGGYSGYWDVFAVNNLADYIPGQGVPTPLRINVFASNLFDLYPNYLNLKAKAEIIYTGVNNGWGKLSGNINSNGEVSVAGVNSNKYVDFNFENLDTLTVGKYSCEVYFTLYGTPSGSPTPLMLDMRSVFITLNISGDPNLVIKPEKSTYTLIYNRSNNTLSGDTLVKVLNNTNNDKLSFGTFGSILEIVGDFTTQFNLVENSAKPMSTNTDLPNQGKVSIDAYVSKYFPATNTWQRQSSFQISLIVINEDMVVTPDSLVFDVVKSRNEVKKQTLSIVNPYNKAFTITGPTWLTLSAASGNGTIDIEVANIASGGINEGVYNNAITVAWDNKVKTIPVTLNVISFVTTNINEDFNFCLDNKVFTVYKMTESARFVKVIIKARFTNATKFIEIEQPLTMPYFQSKCVVEIGKKIQAYFLQNKESLFGEAIQMSLMNNKLWMKPAVIFGEIIELDADYKEVYRENLPGVKLYPGKKPLGFPLLTNHLIRSRRDGGIYFFTYISGQILPNQLIDANVNANAFEAGSIERVKVEELENKIFFSKKKIFNFGTKQLQVITLPSGPQQVHVQWFNQNFAIEWATFNGEFKISTDFTHTYSQSLITKFIEKYGVDKVKNLTINTGFLLKKEASMIEEIVESKLCYLKIGTKVYKAFCILQKLVTEDTTLETAQWDLEFLIVDTYGN